MDIFGEIGGIAFTDEGRKVEVLCCDVHRGGILQLNRCGAHSEPVLDSLAHHSYQDLAQDEDLDEGSSILRDQDLEPF